MRPRASRDGASDGHHRPRLGASAPVTTVATSPTISGSRVETPAGTSIQPRARPSCLFSESSSDTDPICSPYASDIELNVSVARRFCRQAVDGGRSRPHPTCCSRSSWANPASRIWRCSWVRAVEQMRGHMDRHHPEQVDLRLPIRGSVNLSMLALQAYLG